MATTVEEILAHHGIKGMHWGVRRASTNTSEHLEEHEFEAHHKPGEAKISGVTVSKTARPSDDATRAAATAALIKVHGHDAVSNGDLSHLVNRQNLINQHRQLQPASAQARAGKFVADTLRGAGKQEVQRQTNEAVRKQVAKSLAKKAVKTAVVTAVV